MKKEEIKDYIEVRIHSKLQSDNKVLLQVMQKVKEIEKNMKKLEVNLQETLNVLQILTKILK